MQTVLYFMMISVWLFLCWQGGQSTSEEMCLTFPVYYPRTRMSTCLSLVNPEAFIPFVTGGQFTQ